MTLKTQRKTDFFLQKKSSFCDTPSYYAVLTGETGQHGESDLPG